MSRHSSDIKAIPRRILISDPSDINCSYSSTPGGTLYSTTPGGTRIVYERAFLMNLRNSPISKTPPSWELPNGVAKNSSPVLNGDNKKIFPSKKRNLPSNKKSPPHKGHTNGYSDDAELFHLDI